LSPIVKDALLMLVIMNPFAQTLYLSDLIDRTETEQFRHFFYRATTMTFGVCLLCAWAGTFILFTLFQVSIPAMRVFGGLINLSLAYGYIMRGPTGIRLFRGDIAEIAQRITLPVMVGAGVVWICIRIGNNHAPPAVIAIFLAVLAINGALVLGYQRLIKKAESRAELMLIKYFGMAMRLNAMLIGALSIEMILGGIGEYFGLPTINGPITSLN
jgi:small neutral amino acid transporter SnatA (MarC family)